MISIQHQYGRQLITAKGNSLKEAVGHLTQVFDLPAQCGNCDSKDIQLTMRETKGYEFYSVVCCACEHEFKLGQTKEGDRLFPKSGEWEPPYQPKGGGGRRRDYEADDDF